MGIDWLWRVRGAIPVAPTRPSQSILEDIYESLNHLEGSTTISGGDTLTIRRRFFDFHTSPRLLAVWDACFWVRYGLFRIADRDNADGKVLIYDLRAEPLLSPLIVSMLCIIMASIVHQLGMAVLAALIAFMGYPLQRWRLSFWANKVLRDHAQGG